MQALVDQIFESKSLMFAAAAIAFLVAGALILVIFRLVFGRRLRMPGSGRARLPRLGIVDAFDLDRQRQLVIVRRDNVEHLIMIGGPNDLVIESEIIRAEVREGRIRDREPREAAPGPNGVVWPPEFDAPRPAPPPVSPQPRKAPFPVAPEPESAPPPAAVAFDEPIAPPPAPSIHAPAPRPPVFPLPPRRTPPLSAPLPQRTPPQREPSLGRSDPSKSEGGPSPSSGFPRPPLATPFLRPSPPRQLLDTLSVKPAKPAVEPPPPASPPASPEPVQAALEPASEPQVEPSIRPVETAAPASSVGSTPPEPPAAAQFDPIDSLEEEMAKLLGRGQSK